MRCLIAPLAALALAATAAPASAGFQAQLDPNWTQYPALVLNVSYNGEAFNNVLVGQYRWNRTGGDPINFVGASGNQFLTFCTELTQEVYFGQTAAFNVVEVQQVPNPGIQGGMGSVKADMLRQYFGLHYSNNFTSAEAAAFQLGIWEIVFDDSGSLNVSSGQFRLTSNNAAVNTMANSWLVGINGDLSGLTSAQRTVAGQLVGLSDVNVQDQLTLQNGHVYATPGPSGLILVLSGVGPVVLLRRLRRR